MVVFASAYMEMAGECRRLQSITRHRFCVYSIGSYVSCLLTNAYEAAAMAALPAGRRCAVPPTPPLSHKSLFQLQLHKPPMRVLVHHVTVAGA